MKLISIVLVSILLTSCTTKKTVPGPAPKDKGSPIKRDGLLHEPVSPTIPKGPPGVVCLTVTKSFEGKYGKIELPIKGKTVEESHYLTTEDRKKVVAVGEYMIEHLERSKTLYPSSIYNHKWRREWTPAEGGGQVGVGARSDWRPSVLEEMWQGNMYFSKLPPLGTKFLACNEKIKKCAILHFGYEIGPNKKYGIAGVTTEAYQYLKADTGEITFKYPLDQSLPFGPVVCE